jgi:hypothetical protein
MAVNRSELSSDSLELLLDTICNVFGGIILMAILVIMQAQAGAGRLPQPTPDDVDRAIEAQRLRFESGRREDHLATLRESKARVDEMFYATTSPTGERLSRTIDDFRRAIDEATRRTTETQDETANTRRAAAETAEGLARAERLVQDKQAEIEQLERQLREDPVPPGKHLRLPHRRGSARGKARYYIVRGNSVFPFGSGGLERWEGGPYTVEACMVTPIMGKTAAAVRPIPAEAVVVPAEGTLPGDFLATLAAYPSGSHYVVFFVRPDSESYAAFQRLKRAILDRGYTYVVSPNASLDDTLYVSPTAYHETE